MDHEHFKMCPGCGKWLSLEDILVDPDIRPLGLTLDDADFENCWFYFQHEVTQCRSSFVVPASWFAPIVEEPIPPIVKTGTERCEGRCVRIDDWAECHNDCHHAPFRRLLMRMAENRRMAISSIETVSET